MENRSYRFKKKCENCGREYGSDYPNDNGLCYDCEMEKNKMKGLNPSERFYI